jgi:hypothetical protein
MTRSLTLVLSFLALLALALPMGCPSSDDDDDTSEPPLGLLVTPEEPVVTVGGEIQLVATAFYESGDTAVVTAAAQWSVVQGSAVDVSNGLDQEGQVTGLSEGTAAVEASYEGLTSDAVVVRVTNADVVGLSVTPTSLDLEVGESAWLTAMADFSDGTRGDLSGSVRWITADSSVVTLASDGKATAVGTGTTSVRAEYEDIASEAVSVNVTGATGDDDDDFVGDDDDATGLPNLTVTYFSAYVDYTNTVTYYSIDVTNDGSSVADIFFVDLFIDAYSTPTIGMDGDEYDLFEDLAAGDTIWADFEVNDVPDYYEWWSYVILDTSDDVNESNESDNIVGPLDVY